MVLEKRDNESSKLNAYGWGDSRGEKVISAIQEHIFFLTGSAHRPGAHKQRVREIDDETMGGPATTVHYCSSQRTAFFFLRNTSTTTFHPSICIYTSSSLLTDGPCIARTVRSCFLCLQYTPSNNNNTYLPLSHSRRADIVPVLPTVDIPAKIK